MSFRNTPPPVPARQTAAEKVTRERELDEWREATKSIDWKRRDRFWRELDNSVVSLDTFTDKRIWETVIWLINSNLSLARAWATPQEAAFGLPGWLAQQPIFRTLVVEAAGRGLSFPPAAFNYIRMHLDSAAGPPPGTGAAEPWRDENLRAVQKGTLDRLAGIVPEPYEKQLRNISFEE